jgi:hypothetical protein
LGKGSPFAGEEVADAGRRSSHGYAASVYASGDVALPGRRVAAASRPVLLVDAIGRDLIQDVIGWDRALRGYVLFI